MFLLVPAYPGCLGSKAVKRSLFVIVNENFTGRMSCMKAVTVAYTRTHARTHVRTYVYWPFVQDYPGEPVPEGKTNLDFTEARDSEWQWHQLSHMQVCTLLQTENHAITSPLSFLQPFLPPSQQCQSTEGNGLMSTDILFYIYIVVGC